MRIWVVPHAPAPAVCQPCVPAWPRTSCFHMPSAPHSPCSPCPHAGRCPHVAHPLRMCLFSLRLFVCWHAPVSVPPCLCARAPALRCRCSRPLLPPRPPPLPPRLWHLMMTAPARAPTRTRTRMRGATSWMASRRSSRCVCLCERGRERMGVCVCAYYLFGGGVCVCVCDRERKREGIVYMTSGAYPRTYEHPPPPFPPPFP